jgi:hypothetical protein
LAAASVGIPFGAARGKRPKKNASRPPRLEAEILVLRQQINVLRRKSPKRPALSNIDRLLLVWLSRLVPTTLEALTVVRPETVMRWHRAVFGPTGASSQDLAVAGRRCHSIFVSSFGT